MTVPVTSLSGVSALSALTPTEATQLCDDTAAYFGAVISMATTCKWRGLAYGASSSPPSQDVLRQRCSMQESNCNQGGDPWASNFGCDIPATCTATVADYSACIRDEVAAFLQTVNALPMCASLLMSDTSAIINAESADPPASCASLLNTCPELTPASPLNLP